MMKLLPHVLVRISGGAFNQIHDLECFDTFEHMQISIATKKELDEFRNSICDTIYSTIPDITEPQIQNLLINLRRDIFNDRKINAEKWDMLSPSLPRDLVEEIAKYFSLQAKWMENIALASRSFEKELSISRQKFKKMVQNAEFQKGLILSSQPLLNQIRNYIEKDELKNKEIQTERGLIRYLTRMYTKTSPFSTFTNLAMAQVKNQVTSENGLDFSGELYVTESHIRINNYLLAYLKGLFGRSPGIYRNFCIRPNPTIKKTEAGYIFLTNHNNKEAFQRFPANAVVVLIQELVSRLKEGLIYSTLVSQMKEHIDAEDEELEGYINQLISYGFLEFNIGVSGTDPDWDITLAKKLAQIKHGHILLGELSDVLGHLRQLGREYGTADVNRRKNILTEAYNLFRDVCMKIHEEAGLPEEERKPRELIVEEFNLRQQEIKKHIDLRRKEEKKKKKDQKSEDIKPIEPGVLIQDASQEVKTEDPAMPAEEKKEEAFRHLTSTYFSFKPEQIFFEDTSLKMSSAIDKSELDGFINKVARLFDELKLFRLGTEEDDKMKHFFKGKYGHEPVNVLDFYEDYYKEFKQPEAEYHARVRKDMIDRIIRARQEQNTVKDNRDDTVKPIAETEMEQIPDFLKIPSINEKQEKAAQWTKLFSEKLTGMDFDDSHQEYHIKLDWISEINQAMNIDVVDPATTSRGIFVQFFKDNGTLKGVLNNVFPGFSKLTSRFLHIFDKSNNEEALQWNRSQEGDALFIENSDASYFNANLHPPLLSFEIWMPGSNNSLPVSQQISVTDLEILYQEDTDKLQLIHKPTGKEVFIFDLGFQAINGRSQLFQLLSRFTLMNQPFYHIVLSTLNGIYFERNKKPAETTVPGIPAKRSVVTVPRIIIEDQVIIQRKGWFIPKEMLPSRPHQETDFAYFQRINEWKNAFGVPDEVFVSITSQQELQQMPLQAKVNLKLGRDEYKPQYISFKNPLLVSLFEKLLDKVPATLRLDEVLPAHDQLTTIGGNKHATECLVQWFEGKEIVSRSSKFHSEAAVS